MSLSKAGLKTAMMNAMSENPESKEEAMEMMAGAIVDYFVANLEVVIPAGSVLTGGVGQYTPSKNGPTPPQTGTISCEVS